MRTIKRNVAEIAQIRTNGTKYLNQFEFKGIMEDNNIFGVDQNSCKDAQNVFVSFENRLKSRPTLQKDNLPAILDNTAYFGYDLIEIKQFGSNKVYVFLNTETNRYYIVYIPKNEAFYKELSGLTKYSLTSVEHYIICFNDINAKIIDVIEPENTIDWKPLSENTYVPITQETTGSSTKLLEDVNAFTGQTKHVYNWSNNSRPQLPNGNAEVTIITPNGKQELGTLINADVNTDYRLIKKLNRTIDGSEKISAVGDILCIAYSTYMLLSYNGGVSFDTIYYDEYTGLYLNVATLSDDGQYFFYLASDGVHRYNLSSSKWNTIIKPYDDTVMYSDIVLYRFLTGDVFAFVGKYNGDIRLYVKGPGIYVKKDTFIYDDGTDNSIYKMAWIDTVLISSYTTQLSLNGINANTNMLIGIENDKTYVIYDRYILRATDVSDLWIDGVQDSYTSKMSSVAIDSLTSLIGDQDDYKYVNRLYPIAINDMTYTLNSGPGEIVHHIYGYTFDSMISMSDNNTGILVWYYCGVTYTVDLYQTPLGGATVLNLSFTYDISTKQQLNTYTTSTLKNYYPKKLEGGFIDYSSDSAVKVYSNMSNQWSNLNIDFAVKSAIVTGDTFYIVQKGSSGTYSIYTNKFYTNSVTSEEDIAQIVYTVGSAGSYTKVPQVTYSDTEIYLGTGSTLQITQNRTDLEDNTKTLFYLPNSNDQKFIDEITGMINISTTEVAIFFKDNIIICSKVQDENISTGYRYDYYNTKLSVGIRLGDSIINTIEGQYTIFPTNRGLAIMNYQAFMATTDQVVQYITDNVSIMWSIFYENSTMIKITQWRTYLILTNGSGDMLLYNIISNAWWRWRIPINVYNVITDQERLWCINKLLYKFKDQKELKLNGTFEQRRYYDFSEREKGVEIEWFIKSQPLHFGAPTYYKNIKQLIFQFYDADENISYDKTLDAQVKLYRKKITVTEPENIEFKIEGLRTFVKRFNYWKINELQWAVSNDTETTTPSQFEINSISVKYEIGEEVR